jgi:hypothetical protein
MDAENVHGRILIGVDRGGGEPDFFDGIKTREKNCQLSILSTPIHNAALSAKAAEGLPS